MRLRSTKKSSVVILLVCVIAFSFSACEASGSWQDLYNTGMQREAVGDYKGAAKAFSKAIKADDQEVGAYIARADAYMGSARAEFERATFDKALKYCDKALTDYEAAAGLGYEGSEKILQQARLSFAGLQDFIDNKEEYFESLNELYDVFSEGDKDAVLSMLCQDRYSEISASVLGDRLIFEGNGPEKLGIYSNGYYYFGGYENGKRSGQGMWLSVREYGTESFEGQWECDLPHGEGVRVLNNLNSESCETVTGNLVRGYFHGDTDYYRERTGAWERDIYHIFKGRLRYWNQFENSMGFIYGETFYADEPDACWYVGGLAL